MIERIDRLGLQPVLLTADNQNAAELRVVKLMRDAGHDGLIVGASGCALCCPCAQLMGEPCKFPECKYSCMSAYCIFVKKLAAACGMKYNCGEGMLGLFGMYVIIKISY